MPKLCRVYFPSFLGRAAKRQSTSLFRLFSPKFRGSLDQGCAVVCIAVRFHCHYSWPSDPEMGPLHHKNKLKNSNKHQQHPPHQQPCRNTTYSLAAYNTAAGIKYRRTHLTTPVASPSDSYIFLTISYQ